MNLATTYLGFELPHPLVPGASPLVDDLDTVRRLEDAGAAGHRHALAVRGADRARAGRPDLLASRRPRRVLRRGARATSPSRTTSSSGPDEYLEQIRKIKAAVRGAGDRLAQRHHATAAGSATPG